MEALIGREQEKTILAEIEQSGNAEFVAVYGRRRVGKTFLINHTFAGRFAFKMTGVIEGSLSDQLMAFTDAMEEFGYEMKEPPKDWMSAFIMLKKALRSLVNQNEKCILFFDELPAMDAGGSNVSGALGYFWNEWAGLQDNILLVVCGSATSWMISNVIDSKGGLHDRITCEMHIHPFSLHETEKYLESRGFMWTRLMVLNAYMVFGGIPYYLKLLDSKESCVQNIDRLFFSKDMRMRREFKRLFSTLYRTPSRYIDIVKALAFSKKGMTRQQIAEKLKCDNNGHLGEKLDDLVLCDLVTKNVVREKRIKRKEAIYQVADFYSLFYLSFIDRAELESNYWSHHVNTPETNVWLGLAFERVCISHVENIKRALKIDGISTLCYSWRSKNPDAAAQIDLVIERADRVVNICEAKYSLSPYELKKTEFDKIIHRRDSFMSETQLRHAPWITMITTEGLKPGMYSDMIQNVITLDDLF